MDNFEIILFSWSECLSAPNSNVDILMLKVMALESGVFGR
jgi:hypothetical protein